MRRLTDSVDSKIDKEKDKAYYKHEIGMLNGYHIQLYGLNTCINSDWFDENDCGEGHKLFLPKLGYHALVDTQGTINLVMMHHPLDRVVHARSIATFLDKYFPIQIFGHLHKPVCKEDKCLHIQSGALQPQTNSEEGDEYFSVYNILEIGVMSDENENDFLEAYLNVQRYNLDSEVFETLDSESHYFKMQLQCAVNRWSNVNIQKQLENDLPTNVSRRKVRLCFLNHHDQMAIINHLNIYTYNDDISLHENCLRFLELVEKESKYASLWNLVK